MPKRLRNFIFFGFDEIIYKTVIYEYIYIPNAYQNFPYAKHVKKMHNQPLPEANYALLISQLSFFNCQLSTVNCQLL